MNVLYLRKRFAEVKKYETDCADKLMDFAKFLYIQGHLTATEFRNSMKVLEASGAENPAYE
ncbi:YppF family protein [Bacillus velezensis]|uniref:YppF family protein n=1 Tax=Bacillus velezensis TaxID=492670 RepID=UPI0034E38562